MGAEIVCDLSRNGSCTLGNMRWRSLQQHLSTISQRAETCNTAVTRARPTRRISLCVARTNAWNSRAAPKMCGRCLT